MFEVQAFSSSVNVAFNKTATQSSTYSSSYVATKAVDGLANTFSHTSVADANAWWMVDFDESDDIESVNILNRYCGSQADPNNCLGRLSYARLSLIDNQGNTLHTTYLGDTTSILKVQVTLPNMPCASSVSPTKSPSTSSSCSDIKQIKIQATTGAVIHMFEVQALSSGVNVAFNKNATQSSTHSNSYVATKAVDNNNNTFSHTAVSDANAWWMVDLQEVFAIDSLTIINRYCSSVSDPTNCLGRLSEATLSLIDQQGAVRFTTSLGNTASKHVITILPSCSSSSSTPVPTKSPATFSTTSPSSSSMCSDVIKVKIQATTGAVIQMFEVQALSSGVNVAFNKNATQSSTHSSSYVATKAVDNNNSTFSHTSVSDANAWWMVDLLEVFSIDSLTIINRYCSSVSDPTNCLGRLSDATLSLIDQQGAVRYTTTLGNTTSKRVITILPTCPPSSSTPVPSKSPTTSAPSQKPTVAPTKMLSTPVPSKSPAT
jgi:hypothetical protein